MASRHARRDRCPFCNASHFGVSVGFTKPTFNCLTGCGQTWQSGKDGDPYLEHAQNYVDGGPGEWVAFIWKGSKLLPTGKTEGAT